jgi:hypothetical protein
LENERVREREQWKEKEERERIMVEERRELEKAHAEELRALEASHSDTLAQLETRVKRIISTKDSQLAELRTRLADIEREVGQ